MQTGKNSIEGIFDATRVFNVPIYQRAYSWERDKHLTYFLSDLVNQPLSEDRPYFLGSFLFHLRGKRGDFQIVDIVDGQQRLTTFIIFMNSLIKELVKRGSLKVSERTTRKFIKDGDVYKLELQNEDKSFLYDYILGDQEVKDIYIKTPSQGLLIEAKTFFIKELEKLDNNIIEKIFDVSTKADVLLYVVEKINTATQIFELLNDRGKKLTDLESIKSFLMYNIGLVSNNPDQLIENVQTNFSEIYRLIEAHNINEADILRYHTLAFEKHETNPKEFIKHKINHSIKNDEKETTKEVILTYARRLKESFEVYKSISSNEDGIMEFDKLRMIGRVKPYYPIMMYVKKSNPDQFQNLLRNLVKFTFKASLTSLRSNGESALFTSHKNNEDIVVKVGLIIDHNWWNINNRAKDIINYSNYYEWLSKNIVRYILFTYENSLRAKKGFPQLTIKEYFSDDPREKLNIEHISAKKALGVEYDKEFKERHLHSIGNLVIDSAASNSSKRNVNTGDKLTDLKNAPLMSQNEISDISCNWGDLNSIKQFIVEREQKLKSFICQEFNI